MVISIFWLSKLNNTNIDETEEEASGRTEIELETCRQIFGGGQDRGRPEGVGWGGVIKENQEVSSLIPTGLCSALPDWREGFV